MKMEQSVPKRSYIKSRRREITQKKAYNFQNKAKVWDQEKKNAFQPCEFEYTADCTSPVSWP